MKNDNIINGEIIFYGNNCTYSFKDNILFIYCLKGEAKHLLFDELKTINGISLRTAYKNIESDRLKGIIFGSKNQEIVFYIYTSGYGVSGSIDGEKTILKVNIKKYVVITDDNSVCNKIVLGSKQYHKFLNIYPNYTFNVRFEDKIAEVTQNSSSYLDKGEFIYEKHKYLFYPYAYYSGGGTRFEFVPELIIEPDYELSEYDLIFIVDNVIMMLKLLFMRNNIYPDYIEYHNNGKKYELFYNKGIDYIDETEDVDSYFSRGFISWKTITTVIQKVLDDIIDKKIDNRYIGNDTKYRTYIDSGKVSSYAAFFENIYSMIYGNVVKHKSSSQKEIDCIKENLESLKKKDKKSLNDKIDYLIKQLDHVTLSTKIQKVFKDYNDCLLLVKNELRLKEYSILEIANNCANLRNWTDHGDNKATIDGLMASCFAYLNCATYAMIMRRWGLKDEDIKVELRSLYLVK